MYKNIYTTIFPFLQKKTDAPAAETPVTLEAQTNSALDSSSPRGGVLFTPGETVPNAAANLMPVEVSDGTLFVNQNKTGFQDPQEVRGFVDQNGIAPLIGKAENIPNNSDADFALRTEDSQGNELSTSAVTNEQSALEQANLDRQSFGDGVKQTVVPSDEVAQRRRSENQEQAVGGIASENPTLETENAPQLFPRVNSPRRSGNEAVSGSGITSDNAPVDSRSAPYVVNRGEAFNSTQDELDYQQRRAANPQNEDKGVRGFLKEIAQNFLYGMAMGGQVGGNNPDWKQVLLSGGMGTGFGMLNRSWNEQRDAERRIPVLQQKIKQENEQQKFQSDILTAEQNRTNSATRIEQQDRRLNQAEQKNADSEYDKGFRRAMAKLKLGYKRGAKPELDEELKRYGINIEQWDDNKRTFWQGQNLMTFDQNGEAVQVKNERGEAVTDATRAPVEVNYNGQKYTVSNTVAYQGATNTGYRNTVIQNQNVDDLNDYQNQVTKWENDVKESGGKVSVIDNELVGLTNRDADLSVQEQTVSDRITANENDLLKADQVKKDRETLESIQKERRDTQTKINAKKGELSGAKQTYEGLQKNKPVKPQPRQQTEVPTNSSGLRLTADEIRANGKKNGKTDAEIEGKITEWRNAGLLIEK